MLNYRTVTRHEYTVPIEAFGSYGIVAEEGDEYVHITAPEGAALNIAEIESLIEALVRARRIVSA